MALSVVYFRIMHRLGRPHYVWDEYLYSVLEKVEVRVTVNVSMCVCVCVCVCVCSNPLHYYALLVPHRVGRWH